MNKMPEFYMTFARKIRFSRILGAILDSKAESERTRPKHQLRDHGAHRSTGAIIAKLTIYAPATAYATLQH